MSRFHNRFLSPKLLASSFVLAMFVGCQQLGLNNPFNPSAELRVISVTSSEEGRFVGIRQSASTEGGVPFTLYSYADPILTLENRTGLPPVDFKSFSVVIRLSDGTVLPQKEYPLSQATLEGQQTLIQFPILSIDTDVRDVVYTGNNAPRVSDGMAEVTLKGTDTNGNDVSVDFEVPLRFESLIYPTTQVPPELAPEPTPTPETTGGQ